MGAWVPKGRHPGPLRLLSPFYGPTWDATDGQIHTLLVFLIRGRRGRGRGGTGGV